MIHIVDDEEAIRDALQFLFASRGLEARGWPSGEAFLAAQPLADCTAIILDVRMEGISGPEVFERLRTMGIATPVIFLTGHAEVATAVEAMKHGAFDFIEKPFSAQALLTKIKAALDSSQQRYALWLERQAVEARIALLTERERDVIRQVVAGRSSREISEMFGISVRTVENHRIRIREKLHVESTIELVKLFV